MNKIKNIVKITVCMSFVLVMLTGCGNTPKLKDGSELVIEMDGLKMTVDDFYEKLKDSYGTYTLINSIDELLLNETYKTTDEMDEKIQAQIVSLKEQFGSDFNDAISYYYGVSTQSELYNYIEMSFKRELATNDYAATLITDDDINKYYEEKSVGDIKASHILIKADVASDATDADKKAAEEKALATAKEIIKKLDNGEDFAALAKEYSSDSSASDGGNLGYFNRGDMVSEFEDAAIKLEVGKYTETPVKTTYGYHIILKTDQKEKPELKDIRDEIISTLKKDLIANTSNIQVFALDWLREEHGLKIYDAELKIKYDHYINEQKTASDSK